jgi:hypothetical protein
LDESSWLYSFKKANLLPQYQRYVNYFSGDVCVLHAPLNRWLFGNREQRQENTILLFDPMASLNCWEFVFISLYAARLVSKIQLQRALNLAKVDPYASEYYQKLGFLHAKPLASSKPQAGDLLFTTHDGNPSHIMISDGTGGFYDLNGDLGKYQRVKYSSALPKVPVRDICSLPDGKSKEVLIDLVVCPLDKALQVLQTRDKKLSPSKGTQSSS